MNVGTLVDYLKQQSDKGVSHVYLSQAARDAVRSAIKTQKQTPQLTQPSQPVSSPPAEQHSSSRVSNPASQTHNRVVVQPTPPQKIIAPDSVTISLSSGNTSDQYLTLKELAQSWAPALSLQTMHNRLVFGTGNPNADLMIIGDAPTFDDEIAEAPFYGKSGQKLDQILKAMTLQRDNLYLTNLCKFRPKKPHQTTDLRNPTSQELASWMPILQKEIEIVKPKCLLVLGAIATQALLQKDLSEVTKLRGTWQQFSGVPLLPSYHPVYLLRNANNKSAKRKMWEDMLALMEHLVIPISDKQRTFFT